MSLITDTEKLKKHIGGIQKSLEFNTMRPFVGMAERRYIIPAIGQALFKRLESGIVGEGETPDETTRYTELRDLTEIALAWFTYLIAMPHMRVATGDAGIVMNQPSRTTMAPKWAHIDVMKSAMAQAEIAIEYVLDLLSQNPDDYPVWRDDQFAKHHELFLNSAMSITRDLPVVAGRHLTYLALKPYLVHAEKDYVSKLTTPEVFNALKAKWVDTEAEYSNHEGWVIELIQKAVAPRALLLALPYLRIQLFGDGIRVLNLDDALVNELSATDKALEQLRADLVTKTKQVESDLLNYLNEHATSDIFPSFYERAQLKKASTTPLFTQNAPTDGRANNSFIF